MKYIQLYDKFLNKFIDFNLSHIELMSIAKYGLENDYSFSGCWDDSDSIDDAIQCAVEDFNTFLSIPYPVELGSVPETLEIYRLVKMKSDIFDDSIYGYGKSWYSNPDQTNNKEFFDMLEYLKYDDNQGHVYRIKATTNISNIDVYNTLWQRSTQWWENEIVVIDDTKNSIDIISTERLYK